jgi:hypothetical protein
MAGGSLTVTMDTNAMGPAVAERLLCWASTAANKAAIRTDSGRGAALAFVVPEANFGAGSLVLKRGGTDLVSGYVAGTNITYHVTNGMAIEQNVNTCPSSAAQPTTTGASFATNVGGNPLATTLTYANVGSAGTVNIAWGDGTSTLAAAESGTANHTYPNNGLYTITISDVTSPTDSASMVVHVP